MKITYIDHSSFIIEKGSVVFIFDYVKGSLPDFSKETEIYVFFSHGHGDHFHPSVFQKLKKYPNIIYILSDDISISNKEQEENSVYFMAPDKTLVINEIMIETLKSTDLGVAFLVTCQENTYYHGGDLNWWHWNGETSDYNKDMEAAFKREIKKIEGRNFQVAFLPLDPRQESAFWWGFDYFMKHTDVKMVYPMHLWGNYEWVEKLRNLIEAEKYKEKIIPVWKENQVWEWRGSEWNI